MTHTHRDLRTRDVIELVFERYPAYVRTYRACALVCRAWSAMALDYAWEHVTAEALLRLLAPLVQDKRSKSLRFARPIKPNDWARFLKYNYRVRGLDARQGYHWNQFHGVRNLRRIHPSVFTMVRDACPLKPTILPNLMKLDMCANLDIILLFGKPSVVRVGIDSPESSPKVLGQIIGSLDRMPKLTHLELSIAAESVRITPILVTLLPKLSSLEYFNAPAFCISPQLATVLSRLPCLEYIATDGHGDGFSLIFARKSAPPSFPRLKSLTMSIPFNKATSCFASGVSITSLKELAVLSPGQELSKDYKWLVKAIGQSCSNLDTLHLATHREAIDPPHLAPLPLATFKPLHSCHRLSSLTIGNPLSIRPTEAELIALVKALPLLRHLDLGSGDDLPTVEMGCLAVIAPFCPHLEYLCLSVEFRGASSHAMSPITPFKSLEALDVGVSPIDEPNSVARFLSQILPAGCNLDYEEGGDVDDDTEEGLAQIDAWDQVASLLSRIRSVF